MWIKTKRSRVSRRALLPIGTVGILLAVLLVAFIGGAGASRPGPDRSLALTRPGPDEAALLERLPELKGIGTSVPTGGPRIRPRSRAHHIQRPKCRAFVPGTARSRPIPTHFGAGPVLVGSRKLWIPDVPGRANGAPQSRCVSASRR
jgi:hypothetical protein